MHVVPVRPDLGEIAGDLAADAVEDGEVLRASGLLLETLVPSEQKEQAKYLLAVQRHDAVRGEEREGARVVELRNALSRREGAPELVVFLAEDRLVGALRPLARPDEPLEAVAVSTTWSGIGFSHSPCRGHTS